MTFLKKILLSICAFFLLGTSFFAFAIDFKNDFIFPLLGESAAPGAPDNVGPIDVDLGQSYVYDFSDIIDRDESFLENMKNIFYPPVFGDESSPGGELWVLIRTIGVGILVLMLVWTGAKFVMYPSNEEVRKSSLMSLLYLAGGIVLFFGATWILQNLLDIGDFSGLLGSGGSELDGLVDKVENSIALQVIGFLKAFAFFAAIIMIAYYGYTMTMALDEEEQLEAGWRGLLNVIVALVLIKGIDYIYFVVQTGDIKGNAMEVFNQVITGLSFVLGGAIFVMIMYIGAIYLTSSGDDERIEKATKLLQNLAIIMVVILLFFLITTQILADLSQ